MEDMETIIIYYFILCYRPFMYYYNFFLYWTSISLQRSCEFSLGGVTYRYKTKAENKYLG